MATLEISQIVYKYLIQHKRADMQLLTNVVSIESEKIVNVAVKIGNKWANLVFKTDTSEQEIKNDILAMYVDNFYFV